MIGHRRKDRTMQHARQMSNHQNYMLTKEMVNRFDSLFTGTPADKEMAWTHLAEWARANHMHVGERGGSYVRNTHFQNMRRSTEKQLSLARPLTSWHNVFHRLMQRKASVIDGTTNGELNHTGTVSGGIHTEEALLLAGTYDSPPPQDGEEDYLNELAGSVSDDYHDQLSNGLLVSATANGHGGTRQQMDGGIKREMRVPSSQDDEPSESALSIATAVEYGDYSQHEQRKVVENFASHRLQRTTRRILSVKRHAPANSVVRPTVSPGPTINQDEFVISRRRLLLRKMRADAELAEAELVYRRELHELQVKKVKLEIDRMVEK